MSTIEIVAAALQSISLTTAIQQRRQKLFKSAVRPLTDMRRYMREVPVDSSESSSFTSGDFSDSWYVPSYPSNRSYESAQSTGAADEDCEMATNKNEDGMGGGGGEQSSDSKDCEYMNEGYISQILYDANENLQVVHPAITDWLTKVEICSNTKERLQEIEMRSQQKRKEGWAEDTIQAYERIEARSLYPLCPPSWKDYYLPLWSQHLFCKTDKEAYLSTLKIAQSSGGYYMKMLLVCAQSIRDPNSSKSNVELFSSRLRIYIRMIQKDASVCKEIESGCFVPLLQVMRWKWGNPTTDELETVMTDHLSKLSERLLKLLLKQRAPGICEDSLPRDPEAYIIPPPSIFGLLIKDAVAAIVAYEPLSARDKFRVVAYLHFSSQTHEAWNCLALAIVAVHCRNNMVKIREALQTAGLYKPVIKRDEDYEGDLPSERDLRRFP